MNRLVVVAMIAGTTGLAIALGVGAPDPGVAERAYAGLAGTLAIAWLVWRLEPLVHPADARGARSQAADDDYRDPGAVRWQDLERALRLGTVTSGDFEVLVRPRLAAIARARGLAPETAAPPGHTVARDRSAPGVALEDVARIVAVLEQDPWATSA